MRSLVQTLAFVLFIGVLALITPVASAQPQGNGSASRTDEEARRDVRARLRELIERGDADPRGSTNLEWRYEYNAHGAGEGAVIDMEFDVEGNAIVVYQSYDFPLRFAVAKIDGAVNSTPTTIWTTESTYLETVNDCAVDLDGNIYVGGQLDLSAGAEAGVVKLSPSGDILWRRAYGNELQASAVQNIAIGEDNAPFASSSNGVFGFLFRIDPTTGYLAWVTRTDELTCASKVGANPEMVLSGEYLYAVMPGFVESATLAARIDPVLGDAIWCREFGLQLPTSNLSRAVRAVDVDIHGRVYIVGATLDENPNRPAIGHVAAINPDGTTRYFVEEIGPTSTQYEVVTAGRDGAVYVGGNLSFVGDGSDDAAVVKYDDAGNQVWTVAYGDALPGSVLPDRLHTVGDISLDRLGNVYATVVDPGPSVDRARIIKLDRETGSEIWLEHVPDPSSGQGFTLPLGLRVDGGGNVYLNSTTTDTTSGFSCNEVSKYSQPFLDEPTVQTASAELMFEGQSLWAPGTGYLVAEEHLFSVSWNERIDEGFGFFIPLLGDFGAGFEFSTDGTLNAGVRAEIDGGTADVHLPLNVEFTIPPMKALGPGSTVTVGVDWTPDPAARLTSRFLPYFNAGLTAGGNYSVYADVYAEAFSEDVFSTVFINESDTFPSDYVPDMNLLDILADSGFPVPGEWSSIQFEPKGLFTATFRTPQMMAMGGYNPATQSFQTVASDRFFMFDMSVTEAILRPFGLTATLEFNFPYEGADDFGVTGEGRALQLIAGVDLGATQQIDVDLVPKIRYEFSDGIESQTIPITQDLVFTLPTKNDGFDGQVEIRATLMGSAGFSNTTDIQIIPGIEWITLDAAAAVWAFGYDLLSFGPYCILCYDWDLSEILQALGAPNPGLVNINLPVFDGEWNVAMNETPLPCMRVLGSMTNRPDLYAASRDSVSMLIYDQTSPSTASFNVTTGGVTKMLLYGQRLGADAQAFIEHWGREEAVPTTHINDSTLLIEVPNRFRLVPGVAKIYVVASGLDSDSIDLAVTYPTPRLDAVNPNLWAADPDLAALPVAVIDGRSFAGNGTFIARRDYYIKMRDDLWSDATDGGFAGGAAEYFPGFDFNQMPGFPAVLWGGASGGTPLPRFAQPVDNGIHNVRIGEHQYDRPQVVPVVICNPGPGGGMSNELELTIAAPVPVASGVEPAGMSPLDIEYDEDYFDPDDTPIAQPIVLRVTGPAHVPYFEGYEEPKYGNFNADSVVRFNGIDLPTTFVSSFLLHAELAPGMV
ncbi:MAG: PQQ-binding-like beta-propeller repeat protein, partial [Phycisphaerales bacterium JB059]